MQQGRPTNKPRTDFGTRIFEARRRLGLSQQEVAAQLDITQSAYAAWERKEIALKATQIAKLADILNCSVDELILGRPSIRGRRGGPDGKARRLFERVGKLPRSQQQHVLTVLEAFVQQNTPQKGH